MTDNQLAAPDKERQAGLVLGLSAFFLWGFLPAYYKLTTAVPADVVVAHRILWSVVAVGAFLALRGRLGEVWAILCRPAIVFKLALSATAISVNWLVFIYAVEQNEILSVSFGYFANPLVSVAIGLIVLKETLSRAQWVAIAIATFAVGVQGVALGEIPWISLALAFSFATYGYLRKTVDVGASPGLLTEALLLSPFAAAYLVWFGVSSGTDVTYVGDPWLLLALIGTGVVTAFPLALFAAGARRLPLTIVGLMQYIAPSIQMLLAIFVYGEEVGEVRFATFALIWVSLAIFTIDALKRSRDARRARTPKAAPQAR